MDSMLPYLPILSASLIIFFLFTCLLSSRILSYFVPRLNAYTHPQNQWIDGLRGIAATLVALNHIPWGIELMAFQKDMAIANSLQKTYQFCIFLGSFGVQIFFCITGMLFINKIIMAKNIDWMDFYQRRILRIVPAYVMVCLLASVIGVIYSWPITEPFGKILGSLPNLFSFSFLPFPSINNFDFIRVLGINWTLGVEWRFYLLLPMVCLFFQKKAKAFIIATLVFAVVDLALWHNSSWVYFISGAMSAPLMSKQFSQKQRRISALVMTVTLILFALFWSKWHLYGMSRWIAMSVLFATVSIARPKILTYKPITQLGLISYSFYLLHCSVLFAIFYIPIQYGHDIYSGHIHIFAIAASLALMVTVVLSCLSYLCIERRFMYSKVKSKVTKMDNIFVHG